MCVKCLERKPGGLPSILALILMPVVSNEIEAMSKTRTVNLACLLPVRSYGKNMPDGTNKRTRDIKLDTLF